MGILANFNFYVYFLAAFWLSAVHLYADENQTTTSASKCDSPFRNIGAFMGVEHTGLTVAVIIIIMVLYIQWRNKQAIVYKMINDRRKNKGESDPMEELAKKFIGKECIVYTFNSQLEVIIKEVSDGAMLVEKKVTLEAVNLDFVTRIREYPRNKNGKKKSIVID